MNLKGIVWVEYYTLFYYQIYVTSDLPKRVRLNVSGHILIKGSLAEFSSTSMGQDS